MKQITHQNIDPTLCGTPLEIGADFARIQLTTSKVMSVDSKGLVHGGFIFGAADYAAMLAVNHPHVVLGSAEVRFLKPLMVHGTLYAEARVIAHENKKKSVAVTVTTDDDTEIFTGTFTCFILEKHVLDR